jgi:hypothetical protein
MRTLVFSAAALLPLVIGLATSVISGRVTLVWARGGAFDEFDAHRHFVWSVVGALAFPAQLVLIVCAFFVIWWPIASALILVCGMFIGLVVTRDTLALFTSIQPMLNLITIVAAAVVVWLLVA